MNGHRATSRFDSRLSHRLPDSPSLFFLTLEPIVHLPSSPDPLAVPPHSGPLRVRKKRCVGRGDEEGASKHEKTTTKDHKKSKRTARIHASKRQMHYECKYSMMTQPQGATGKSRVDCCRDWPQRKNRGAQLPLSRRRGPKRCIEVEHGMVRMGCEVVSPLSCTHLVHIFY